MTLSSSDIAAIRTAEEELAGSFELPDPTAWVPYYTEDAIFSGPGVTLRGRVQLLEAASAIAISSMQISAESTIGDGDFAATFGRGTWVSGAKGSDAPVVQRRFLMVWHRGADGQWRIARELLTED
jgi:ketosteroid isomerase-like protein